MRLMPDEMPVKQSISRDLLIYKHLLNESKYSESYIVSICFYK